MRSKNLLLNDPLLTHVKINPKYEENFWYEIKDMLLWCELNVGVKNEDWAWGQITEHNNDIEPSEFKIGFVFKDKEKALIFKLTCC